MIQFFWWERLEEFWTKAYLPFQRSRFPISSRVVDCHQADDGLRTTRNDDFFPLARLFDQARELSLRLVDSNGLHLLANQS
jgi:hypothetical protein